MGICKCCGGPTNRRTNYCSNKCQKESEARDYIERWKRGEETGMMRRGELSKHVRTYMLNRAGYKCEKCGWHEVSEYTHRIPLEIHHIDGNHLHNTEDNLQVLCPNCHALTPNYKALNKRSTGIERMSRRKNYCIDCGAEIDADSRRCRNCESKCRIKPKPITREDLKNLLRTEPFTSIGEKYNVSDNAIRKWCRRYSLPTRKKEINQYTDEQWNEL